MNTWHVFYSAENFLEEVLFTLKWKQIYLAEEDFPLDWDKFQFES